MCDKINKNNIITIKNNIKRHQDAQQTKMARNLNIVLSVTRLQPHLKPKPQGTGAPDEPDLPRDRL